jgi:hypothetical protein
MMRSNMSKLSGLFGPTEDYRSPVWIIRVIPLIALACVILAEAVWQSGFAHGLCLGLATGQLVVLSLTSFQIANIDYKNSAQPSDVQDLRITR